MRRRYLSRRGRAQASAQNEFTAAAFGQRHAASRDANDGEIVALIEQLGGHFVRSPPLEGWIWVPRFGKWIGPAEIKVPEVEGFKHEYTPQQLRFIRWCQDRGAPYHTLRTRDDVFKLMGAV